MKAPNPRSKPPHRSIDPDLLDVPLEMALRNLVLRARTMMGEPGRIEVLEFKFRGLCIPILSIHHGLQVEDAMSWAKRLWSDALSQGPVPKRERTAHRNIQENEQSDYKAGYEWVFDNSLKLTRDQKVSIEGIETLWPHEGKSTFGTSAHDGMLTAQRKIGVDGRHFILVRRATIDEEADSFGREFPHHMARRTRYPTDDAPNGITPKRLKRLSRARQTETMQAWFESHYKEISYSSEEDSLSEVSYAAIDLLWAEFGEVVQEHVIRDLADKLDEKSDLWVPIFASSNSEKADERSPEEIKHLLLQNIQNLRDELNRIEPIYGQLGHNNPPEDARLFPLSWEDRNQVLRALENIET